VKGDAVVDHLTRQQRDFLLDLLALLERSDRTTRMAVEASNASDDTKAEAMARLERASANIKRAADDLFHFVRDYE
jgi:hypothetical protein